MHRNIKSLQTIFFAACIIAASTAGPGNVGAEELDMVNRPVNGNGLTGLLYTTSPFTLPPGAWEAGSSVSSERSYNPDYSVTSYGLSISHGLNSTMEIAVRSTYWKESESDVIQRRGSGDTELCFKWGLLPPKEYSARPSIALLAAGVAPTGDRESETGSVQHWGFRIGLTVGSELLLEDYVMGIYADGQVSVQDLYDVNQRDWYHTANAGVLLPISKYRNLQMFLEYNRQKGKDAVTLRGDDFSAVTYGLRLVNTRFNLTIGTQFIHKYVEDHDNASRIIGMISVKL